MTAARRFLFDTEFGARRTAEPPPPSYDAAALAQAEERGRARGRAEGLAEAERLAEARTAALLERIAGAAAPFFAGLDAARAELERDAVEVAVTAAKRLAPALLAAEPLIEVAALAARSVALLGAAPHAVVRLSVGEAALAQAVLPRLLKDRGFEGRLVILPDPELGTGDAKIEWAEGGLTRDRAAIERSIDTLVEGYLATRKLKRTS